MEYRVVWKKQEIKNEVVQNRKGLFEAIEDLKKNIDGNLSSIKILRNLGPNKFKIEYGEFTVNKTIVEADSRIEASKDFNNRNILIIEETE